MITGEKLTAHPLRWAMVGGGRGSQIGYIHRSAALRDGVFTLVAGAFDLDPERGRSFGVAIGVAPERCYPDYQAMFDSEAKRADGIQAVSIATPNNTHFAICKAALEAGLHVVCEKPLCFTTAEARELEVLAAGTQPRGRRDLWLCRLPDDRAGQADDRPWRSGRDPHRQHAVRPRLPQRGGRGRPTPRPDGGSIRSSPAPATCWAILGPIRSICPKSCCRN